jgi:hypothetical protein
MEAPLLLMLIAVIAALCAWGFAKPERVYQYPFLAGVVMAGWLLPQAIGLLGYPGLPDGGYETAMMVAILCTIALHLGYTRQVAPVRALRWKFDPQRLLFGALFLSLFGTLFTLLLDDLPEEMLQQTQWSGTTVLYFTLAQTQLYGLALAAIVYALERSKLALAICIFDLFFYLGVIVLAGRRSLTIKLVLIILLALWFNRRIVAPRIAVAIGIIAATLFVGSAGEYRALTGTASYGGSGGHVPTWEELRSIDFVGNMAKLISDGSEFSELRIAINDVSAIQVTGGYNLGEAYWNSFIFATIPAQIVGKDVKDALMFDLHNVAYDVFQFEAQTGGTHTFISDTFLAFWYFGAVVFFVIGRIMSALYRAAMSGHIFAQVAYMTSVTDALTAITHDSFIFFSSWFFFACFMLPILIFAKKKVSHNTLCVASYGQARSTDRP